MIGITIVEDRDVIRESLVALLSGTPGFTCVASYSNCLAFLNELPDKHPDVVLMDIGLPGMSGIEGIRKAKSIFPDINILALTIHEDRDTVFSALCAGANGYLTKQTPPVKILEAVREAVEGGSPMNTHIARQVVEVFNQMHSEKIQQDTIGELTEREKEVLKALADGASYKMIADTLQISMGTVRFHIRNIYQKLHVHSESAAVAKAIRRGLV